jgi:hypothetical protein
MSFNTETPRPVGPPPADTSLAKWRFLTEGLIFAAPYGESEYLRILDATRRPYNRDLAIIRCKALSEAINTDFAHLEHRLLRCHAANDSQAFRLRYARLLPKRPRTLSLGERRTGVSDEQRMAEADELAAVL